MRKEILLIGPMGVGKSTVSALLSERLDLQQISLDDIHMYYYYKQGYNRAQANKLSKQLGGQAMYSYFKPFDVEAVVHMLQDFKNCIFDFGAGHSVYEEKGHFAKVSNSFQPFENVVLLIPSADHEESLAFLLERAKQLGRNPREDQIALVKHFIEHDSNWNLAKFVIYTKDKSPEEICTEVLARVNQN